MDSYKKMLVLVGLLTVVNISHQQMQGNVDSNVSKLLEQIQERLSQLESKMEERFSQLESKIEEQFSNIEDKINEIEKNDGKFLSYVTSITALSQNSEPDIPEKETETILKRFSSLQSNMDNQQQMLVEILDGMESLDVDDGFNVVAGKWRMRYFRNTRAYFHDAVKICDSYGAEVVVVDSQEKLDAVWDLTGSNWIYLNAKAFDDEWVTTGGKKLDFSFTKILNETNPKGDLHLCLTTSSDGRIDRSNCFYSASLVCEKPLYRKLGLPYYHNRLEHLLARIQSYVEVNDGFECLNSTMGWNVRVFNELVTWQQARIRCLDLGSDLLVLDSSEKLQRVKTHLSQVASNRWVYDKLRYYQRISHVVLVLPTHWVNAKASGSDVVTSFGHKFLKNPEIATDNPGRCMVLNGLKDETAMRNCDSHSGFICEK